MGSGSRWLWLELKPWVGLLVTAYLEGKKMEDIEE